jgi:hypothetical protein
VTASIFLLPLHSYDFIAALPAALLVLPFGYRARLCVWVGGVILLKPELLARFIGLGPTLHILLLTAASFLMFAGAIDAVKRGPRALLRLPGARSAKVLNEYQPFDTGPSAR